MNLLCIYKYVLKVLLHPYIDPVQIVLSPEDLMVAAGNLLGVACVAFGDPLPSISWSKDGATLENDIQITILENLVATTDPDIAIYEHRVNKSGVMFVRSVMRIRHMRLIDRGQYSCSAHNGFTNASSSSFLVTVTGKKGLGSFLGGPFCRGPLIL